MTGDVEITGKAPGASIVTTPVRSGTYALRENTNGANAGYINYNFSSTGITVVYYRAYFRIARAPSATSNLIRPFDAGAFDGDILEVKIQSDRTLIIWDEFNGVQLGNTSTALALDTWYRVEFKLDTTSASAILSTARLDGVEFATGSSNIPGVVGQNDLNIGSSTASDLDFYVDDVAINDTTGSFQNSWPGAGQIIHLKPSAAGDSTQWTPDTGSNYARVNEVTPNDATSLVSDVILNDSDLYNVDNSGIGASDTVNVVQVGVRFRNDVADATTQFKVQAEKTTGGTIAQSAAITPNSTTWKTNATANPFNYPLTLHQDPDSSNWTQATLDTMQIGVKSTLIGVNKNQVSTVWALVDYTPVSPLPQLGGLFWRGGIPT